jgi:hypothetical protein
MPNISGCWFSIEPAVTDMTCLGGTVDLVDRNSVSFLPPLKDFQRENISSTITVPKGTQII